MRGDFYARTKAFGRVVKMAFTYQYPRPSVTVDNVIVAKPEGHTPAKVLLIQRKNSPCKGRWALPGGFVDEYEPLEKAAARELQEETSISPELVALRQVGAFGDPGRDPRGWCVTVTFAACVPTTLLGVRAADDASDAQWFEVDQIPRPLAFDHQPMLKTAFERLAEFPDVKADERLVQQLLAAAEGLDGPWEPPTAE
eukprot:jgi/Botrbrau1/5915/Bobra.0366s0090.1